MKEQDYMNIMSMIRGDYLEEAVSWDGSERRRIRQIRRMTVSFGAVAAALAVVVGMIAYKASKERIPVADSVPESSMTEEPEQKQNMFGGHGEISVFPGQAMGDFFRDDEYWYHNGEKWSVSGGRTVPFEISEEEGLFFSDGSEMFRLRDKKIYSLDSYGAETLLVDMSGWQDLRPEPEQVLRIERFGSTLLIASLDNPEAQFASQVTVNLNDGSAQQFMNSSVDTRFACADGGFYGFSSIEGAFRRYDADGRDVSGEALWTPVNFGDLCSVFSDGRKLYAVYAAWNRNDTESPDYDPARTLKTYSVFDPETGEQKDYEIGSGEGIVTEKHFYEITVDDGSFSVYRSETEPEGKEQVYSIPVAQLFDLEDETELTLDMLELCEAGDTMIITLPYRPRISPPEHYPTHHGEEGVIVDLNTGKTFYFGRNYGLETTESSRADEAATVTEVYAEAETAAVTTAETEQAVTTAAVTTFSEANYLELAKDLIERYDYALETLTYGGSDLLDSNDVINLENTDIPRYVRVKAFRSIAEIKQKMAETVTGEAYDHLVACMEGKEGSISEPAYVEIDGKLYATVMGKGAEIQSLLWDTLTIDSVAEDGFTASVKEESFAGDIVIHHFTFTDLRDGTKNSFRVSRRTAEDTGRTLTGEPVGN